MTFEPRPYQQAALDAIEAEAEAEVLARVNRQMSTRRRGGRKTADAALKAQSANYAASEVARRRKARDAEH